MRVLFLDIDGVLNSGDYFTRTKVDDSGGLTTAGRALAKLDPVAIEHLNDIVAGDDVKVVVSSNWRKNHSLSAIRSYLKARGFVGEILSVTPALVNDSGPRAVEIAHWLGQHAAIVDGFVILDDTWDAGLGFHDHFVRTEWTRGLQREHIAIARSMLAMPYRFTNTANAA